MTVTRVRYRERQRLAAEDLLAEQTYRLGAMGRHLLGPHQWGVVRGLWLVADPVRGAGYWLLAPGAAVDGYGRELLVTRPIAVPDPPGSVVLHYCEAQVGIPPCGPCEDQPAPRIGQYVRLLSKQNFDPLGGDPADWELARAAGSVPGHLPWPVLLGVVDPANPDDVDYRRVRYVRHRADQIWSPSREVFLRLGATAANDFYQFLFWTRPAKPGGDPVKRLGVDRDGTIHVWQPLWISGDRGVATVPAAAGSALQITAPIMQAGIGLRLFVKGVLRDPTKPVLEATWADSLGFRVTRVRSLTSLKNRGLNHALEFTGGQELNFRLVKLVRPDRAVTPLMTRQKKQQFKVETFTAEMKRTGGTLTLMDFDPVPTPTAPTRGCDDDSDEVPGVPRGACLRFRPGRDHKPGADTREIYAESLSDSSPATELRIVAGTLDESDSHLRFAFGVRAEDKSNPPKVIWRPILAMDGAGKVVMPAQSDPPFKDTTLDVQGALHLPPIKNDPTDPLVQDLLALAYIAGLRRVGRQLGVPTVTVDLVPAQQAQPPVVLRGKDLVYTVTLHADLKVKRCLALLVGVGGNGHHDVIIQSVPELVGDLKANQKSTDIKVPVFRHLSDRVNLVHEFLVTGAADKEYSLQSQPFEFKVTDPP
jgi:hypothetical protein